MSRYNEFSRGRLEGMRFALQVAEEGGIDALRNEVQLRGATGINPIGRFEEDLDARIDSIMAFALKRVFLVSVAAIHDAYGIGPKRMEVFFDKFDEATRLLMQGRHGGMLWTDVDAAIRETYGVAISANSEGVLVRPAKEKDGTPGRPERGGKARRGAETVKPSPVPSEGARADKRGQQGKGNMKKRRDKR